MNAVLLAAGSGTRMKADVNKVFLKLLGREIILYTLDALEKSDMIDRIIIVTGRRDIDRCRMLSAGFKKVSDVIIGGSTRQESSFIGVSEADSKYVLIHDAARALVTAADITVAAEAAIKFGAAAVGAPCVDTMKLCDSDGFIKGTVEREKLFKIFTPQVFIRSELLKLHVLAKEQSYQVTDDCALFEWGGLPVKLVSGSPDNIKLTVPEDISAAEGILRKRCSGFSDLL
ncbi:MAG: 2-C-methyl-D-erythritol 4-phosphate cytidylyltransferase [Clostridia bacterium]|nr:2-C-methyl-D-erythritol 4-phosphate cytidylyltransferase [Clostridia bacterium]